MTEPVLLGPDARPISPQVIAAAKTIASAKMNATMPVGIRDGLYAYQAQDIGSRELDGWFPQIRSPDSEINFLRDRVVARERDLIRNDGWATGAVSTVLDQTIGPQFRLVAEPDHLALSRLDKRLDATWAEEFSQAVEAEWRLWADDPGHWRDATQQQTMTQLFYLALRHRLIDGEDLACMLWLPEFVGPYGSRYATTVQLIDPDRLSNPYQAMDTLACRGGVEVDGLGAPQAYHIRRSYPNDWYGGLESMIWDRVPRTTAWGRPVIVHDFDKDRVGQNRGMGVLAPVLARFKMLTRYDAAELQQALLQTVIRTFIESPMDHDGLNLLLQDNVDQLSFYQDQRMDFAQHRPTEIGGVRVPRLFPGEKIGSVSGSGPSSNFADFEHAILRSIAAPLGASAEQVTKDWSRTNYSSARGAMADAYKTLARRRSSFTSGFANPIYAAFLEEAIETHLADLMPRGYPPFHEARAAYARCHWIGPARGYVDPVKERQGSVLAMDAGLTTLKRECEEQGLSFREVIEQRALEVKMFKEAGLALPTWSGTVAQPGASDGPEPASKTDVKPQPV